MHPVSLMALVFAGLAIVNQVGGQYHYPSPFFRNYPVVAPHPTIADGRFLFGTVTTFTFTVSTVTSTATTTSVTTCTTSTSALSSCTTAAGRRRRSLVDEHGDQPSEEQNGLFFNEQEEESTDTPAKEESEPALRMARQMASIQPTFGAYYAPEAGFESQAPIGRFFLALGTATVTATVTSTSTSSLTAICSSTTSYKACS